METKPNSKLLIFIPVLFLLLSTLSQQSSSAATNNINGKYPSFSKHRTLLASQRNNKINQQIPNCGEMLSRSQCLQHSTCRWCRSESLDDMCFKKAEAWRLPQQGNPHPGATVGRMSFRSFNPSIDKLNEAVSNACQPDASGGRSTSSENGSASEAIDCTKVGTNEHEGNGDLKRKQADIVSEPDFPSKSPKHDNQSSSSSRKASSKKQSKRDKLDWNILRPPKTNRQSYL